MFPIRPRITFSLFAITFCFNRLYKDSGRNQISEVKSSTIAYPLFKIYYTDRGNTYIKTGKSYGIIRVSGRYLQKTLKHCSTASVLRPNIISARHLPYTENETGETLFAYGGRFINGILHFTKYFCTFAI